MKAFCRAKEASNGKTYYQGFVRGTGKVTIMTGTSKDGADLLIVNMRTPYRQRTSGGYSRRRSYGSAPRSGYSSRRRSYYGRRNSNY